MKNQFGFGHVAIVDPQMHGLLEHYEEEDLTTIKLRERVAQLGMEHPTPAWS